VVARLPRRVVYNGVIPDERPTLEAVATSFQAQARAILFIGSVLIFAVAILCVPAFEWLVDLALK